MYNVLNCKLKDNVINIGETNAMGKGRGELDGQLDTILKAGLMIGGMIWWS